MKRYRLELSLNVWCDSDDQALELAKRICDKQKEKFDNRCQVIKLNESPFGRLEEREII